MRKLFALLAIAGFFLVACNEGNDEKKNENEKDTTNQTVVDDNAADEIIFASESIDMQAEDIENEADKILNELN